ncbi:MAG: hypothetical protein ACI8P0_004558 [Planctomycetaceae bacterium]|jgi:hypothetical protein
MLQEDEDSDMTTKPLVLTHPDNLMEIVRTTREALIQAVLHRHYLRE